MNHSDLYRIIAKEYHTTPKAVEEEISWAIASAFSSPSTKAKEVQALLFPQGIPSPEAFILVLSQLIASHS